MCSMTRAGFLTGLVLQSFKAGFDGSVVLRGEMEGRIGMEERGVFEEAAGTYGRNPPSSIVVKSRMDEALPAMFVGVVASSSA